MSNDEAGEPTRSNREIGQHWMAHILAALYDSWPRDKTIALIHAAGETRVSTGDNRTDLAIWNGLIDWMIDERFIRVKGRTMDGSALAALTSSGYSALGKPAPGSPQKNTGTRLKELATNAGAEAIKAGAKSTATDLAEVVGTFIGNVAKPFLPSV